VYRFSPVERVGQWRGWTVERVDSGEGGQWGGP